MQERLHDVSLSNRAFYDVFSRKTRVPSGARPTSPRIPRRGIREFALLAKEIARGLEWKLCASNLQILSNFKGTGDIVLSRLRYLRGELLLKRT